MTKEEFLRLPEGPPDYEFEDGEVIPLARPSGQHQDILAEILSILRPHVKKNRSGRIWPEIDVELTETKTYIPDLVYLSIEHLDRYAEEDGKIHGAPDLAVEILSPSTSSRDHLSKFTAYFEAGVPWYWLVDPESLGIAEYRATPEGYLRTASVEAGQIFRPGLFPDIEIDLKRLIEGI
jgi:Uma2 family endonuclease